MPALCRDCLESFETGRRCPACGSPRVLSHPELFDLTIAHMDCDAFFASVHKAMDPELADKPVIVGGGDRGVVSTCCYIARLYGVRSAMPAFQARKLCPEAIWVKPRHDIYTRVSRQIRDIMEEMTPSIEPLSLDEAFLDMTGTARLHHAPPAVMLARLVRRMEAEIGISGSIGLSHCKFLAKVASDLEKPRGFSVIGEAETLDFLADKPVSLIWGVGAVTQQALSRAGIRTFSDLRRWDRKALHDRFGKQGDRLWHLARGEDARRVSSRSPVKSISKETTFQTDISALDALEGHAWRLAEKVSDRAKGKNLAGRVVTLKLKRADHKILTRRHALDEPTQLAQRIYAEATPLLAQALEAGPFRLLGIGLSELVPAAEADLTGDLLDPQASARAAAERATDAIRERFGKDAIFKGRSIR
ncbi:DNA polymerase IV [Aliiruegeria sabulilitoris]|uniref:DNA polymerase IV n=1 Tax=Aliiruegeria sabulilitoris TaxID=1510458 RepID=UPI00082C03C3|nr:DNA polymerase IV [Aliiruegeria sabulilitoris]NDR59077.1 DNA polymerase IV [Pseudoruegeria sp. M32A2M]